ncbi:MAG: hypothetical protein ACKOFZ_04325 [Ilumatobacteraceae bacterium]
MYYLEAILLGLLAVVLLLPWFPRRDVLAALSALWVIGISLIHWRYGTDGQLEFYSNDQQLHIYMMGKLEWGGRPTSVFDLIDRRYLYVGPAYLLTLAGFNAAIALKFVSFMCFLVNAVVVTRHLARTSVKVKPLYLWLATGPIVFFFSLLALRETMLLLALTTLLIGRNPSLRVLSLATIGLLRPHLAVALVMAVATVFVVQKIRPHLYYLRMSLVTVGSVLLGVFLYSVAYSIDNNDDLTLARSLIDKEKAYLVLSNLVGLQFLNADFVAIERTLSDLLLPRIVFSETVIVPLLFTISLFIPKGSIDRLKMLIISTFGYYVGIIAGSDFTSFRQNLPFVSVMAVVIIQTFRREHSLDLQANQPQLV